MADDAALKAVAEVEAAVSNQGNVVRMLKEAIKAGSSDEAATQASVDAAVEQLKVLKVTLAEKQKAAGIEPPPERGPKPDKKKGGGGGKGKAKGGAAAADADADADGGDGEGDGDGEGGRRKVKVVKGARDFMPEQMVIREKAFAAITNVFKRHGAVSIDTPVFELRETLTGKYGEDSKLIYDLKDQGGELLSLRYDLTVPFARFVATHNVVNIKRYHIGKVYRRDQPAMNRGRFREFFQCDFDVAGQYPSMVADAEVLKVLSEILTQLDIGQFEVKLNHRGLLDAMLEVAGVPADSFRPICSAIDKLDKEPWDKVREEMVKEKGLPEAVADAIRPFVELRGAPKELLATLTQPDHPLAKHAGSAAALKELETLFEYLDAMGALGQIVFDLSLARGLDYYTGVIYEAVLHGAAVGSIAAGGRYDKLVGMFSTKDVPAVGVSIGIERVFAIMEAKERERAEREQSKLRSTCTQVLVASIGSGLQTKRMELATRLWEAGVSAEFGYKANPKMGDQLGHVLESGIPLMVLFGGAELEQGVVKVKDIVAKTEDVVPTAELVDDIKRRLGL